MEQIYEHKTATDNNNTISKELRQKERLTQRSRRGQEAQTEKNQIKCSKLHSVVDMPAVLYIPLCGEYTHTTTIELMNYAST